VNAPLIGVTADESWISILGMWLFLPFSLIQGIIGGITQCGFVGITIGCGALGNRCCSVMGSVLNGRPLYMAWVYWRAVIAAGIAFVATGVSRLALFLWEWEAFGKGRYWWHGDGVWSGGYADVARILRGQQFRRPAFGCVSACIPDLFPTRLLIFLPNLAGDCEWKAMRSLLHDFFLNQGNGTYQQRLAALPGRVAADWKQPNLGHTDDKAMLQRMVAKCIWFMFFGCWCTDEDATMLTRWRTYASHWIQTRMVHRFLFNILARRVKQLRIDTVTLVEKQGQQGIFIDMNSRLQPQYRRAQAVSLCDELLFAVGFAGIGGTCALVESATAFLQCKLPEEAPKKHINFGMYNTPNAMIAKYKANPVNYLKEVARINPPVTSATSTLPENTKVPLAGNVYDLPKGLLHQYVVSVANRDESVFPQAQVFNPDRPNLNQSLSWNGAFGGNISESEFPRICPGRYLSLEISKVLCNHALNHFVKSPVTCGLGVF